MPFVAIKFVLVPFVLTPFVLMPFVLTPFVLMPIIPFVLIAVRVFFNTTRQHNDGAGRRQATAASPAEAAGIRQAHGKHEAVEEREELKLRQGVPE